MSTTANLSQREALLTPSPQFKKEATKAVFSIVGFIAVYFLLFALSLVIVAACFYGGFALITLRPSFYTIIAGGGIVICGIMIFVFLIKFLFASTKADDSDSVEVTAEEQPKLFETIYSLAEVTGTPKPKKIFLSSDVNAAVFYNSSFWSMFLPVKKNLKIGLGLVNTVNVSELKAVIAHEFGHFSQRSMKVGSWVYQVNKILYDMLFNNRGYANSINSVASLHGIVAFFMQITVQVVKAIQWVLHQMFKVVNKTYMGLSQQMEFHADLVAASACGSNNIISALKRSEFAQVCFSSTLDICNKAWKDKKVIDDFYTNHRTVVKHLAGLNQLNLVNGMPVLNKDEENAVVNRINYKDQWASHPTLEERKNYLEPFGLTAEVNEASAWSLFRDEAKWKEELTKQFYKSVSASEIKGGMNKQEFEDLFTRQVKDFSFPPLFKEFYNSRSITPFNPYETAELFNVTEDFESLLNEDAILLPKRIQYLEQDIATLQSIIKKEIITSSFDFDGKKYPRKQAAEILAILEAEKESLQKDLNELDKNVFHYFISMEPFEKGELKNSYQHYFDQRKNADAFVVKVNNMMNLLGPVFSGQTMSIEAIQTMIDDLKRNYEPEFKKELNYWLSVGAFDSNAVLKNEIEKFIQSRYEYFSGSNFFDNELIELNNTVQDSWAEISNYVFSLFKSITEKEATLLTVNKHNVVIA